MSTHLDQPWRQESRATTPPSGLDDTALAPRRRTLPRSVYLAGGIFALAGFSLLARGGTGQGLVILTMSVMLPAAVLVGLAVDGFGWGSLSYQRRVPAPMPIEIDRCFVSGIRNNEDAAVIRVAIALEDGLEGVETSARATGQDTSQPLETLEVVAASSRASGFRPNPRRLR
jgi:hypothetical protein